MKSFGEGFAVNVNMRDRDSDMFLMLAFMIMRAWEGLLKDSIAI